MRSLLILLPLKMTIDYTPLSNCPALGQLHMTILKFLFFFITALSLFKSVKGLPCKQKIKKKTKNDEALAERQCDKLLEKCRESMADAA